MADRVYYSYEEVHQLVRDLASRMRADGKAFDLIVAIGSGGYIPARIMKTYYDDIPMMGVSLSRYEDIETKRAGEPIVIQWLGDNDLLKSKNVLLIDEIDDTRVTLDICARKILSCSPGSLSVAVLHNKRRPKEGTLPPECDYYAACEVDDHWICYPWEAKDLAAHNGEAGKAKNI